MEHAQVVEYKVLTLAVKETPRWEGILSGFGRAGWTITSTVPVVDASLMGFTQTSSVTFVLTRTQRPPESPPRRERSVDRRAPGAPLGVGARVHTS